MVATLLVQLVVILCAAALGSTVARRLGQVEVLGEIAAGIVLGPGVLGRIAPSFTVRLFAPASLAPLRGLAELGLVLFMFLVGLEFDPAVLRGRARIALATSHGSIAVPFALGALLATQL